MRVQRKLSGSLNVNIFKSTHFQDVDKVKRDNFSIGNLRHDPKVNFHQRKATIPVLLQQQCLFYFEQPRFCDIYMYIHDQYTVYKEKMLGCNYCQGL